MGGGATVLIAISWASRPAFAHRSPQEESTRAGSRSVPDRCAQAGARPRGPLQARPQHGSGPGHRCALWPAGSRCGRPCALASGVRPAQRPRAPPSAPTRRAELFCCCARTMKPKGRAPIFSRSRGGRCGGEVSLPGALAGCAQRLRCASQALVEFFVWSWLARAACTARGPHRWPCKHSLARGGAVASQGAGRAGGSRHPAWVQHTGVLG